LQQANPHTSGKTGDHTRLPRRLLAERAARDRTRPPRWEKFAESFSTSALELGIDVGSLDTVVMAGYAGTIAATWQRAGRAGRRSGSSCAVLVASSAPLDQFIVRHPDYFFGNTPSTLSSSPIISKSSSTT